MEKLALRAQPLHHVHAFTAEEAHVAAADVGGELFSEGALWEKDGNTRFFVFILLKKPKKQAWGGETGSSPYR